MQVWFAYVTMYRQSEQLWCSKAESDKEDSFSMTVQDNDLQKTRDFSKPRVSLLCCGYMHALYKRRRMHWVRLALADCGNAVQQWHYMTPCLKC